MRFWLSPGASQWRPMPAFCPDAMVNSAPPSTKVKKCWARQWSCRLLSIVAPGVPVRALLFSCATIVALCLISPSRGAIHFPRRSKTIFLVWRGFLSLGGRSRGSLCECGGQVLVAGWPVTARLYHGLSVCVEARTRTHAHVRTHTSTPEHIHTHTHTHVSPPPTPINIHIHTPRRCQCLDL